MEGVGTEDCPVIVRVVGHVDELTRGVARLRGGKPEPGPLLCVRVGERGHSGLERQVEARRGVRLPETSRR